jgi:hypothetical protein
VVRSVWAAAVDGGVRDVGPHVERRDVKPVGKGENRIAVWAIVWKGRRAGNNRVGHRGIPKNCANLWLGAGPRREVTRVKGWLVTGVMARRPARAPITGVMAARRTARVMVTGMEVATQSVAAETEVSGAVGHWEEVAAVVGDSVDSAGGDIACLDRWRDTSGQPARVASGVQPECMLRSNSGSGADKPGTSVRTPSGGSVGNHLVAVHVWNRIDGSGAVMNTEADPREVSLPSGQVSGGSLHLPPEAFYDATSIPVETTQVSM